MSRLEKFPFAEHPISRIKTKHRNFTTTRPLLLISRETVYTLIITIYFHVNGLQPEWGLM